MKIIPQPVSLAFQEGAWEKTHGSHRWKDGLMRIYAPPQLAAEAEVLASFLRDDHLFRVIPGTADAHDIALHLTDTSRQISKEWFQDESYRLGVGARGVRIEAPAPHGMARGIQTLRQMISGQRARIHLPCLEVEDAPAFTWRGLHLDCSRHFFPAEDVRRFIDLAAFHKFNLFHWHLTDDQGWRLPVEGYPRLSEVAAWREGTLVGHDCDRSVNPSDGVRHGGIYTRSEIREIVAYAAARGVSVLPEVDVPGHVQALVSAYPEFGNTGSAPGVRQCWGISESVLNLEPETFTFLERVVETLAELFPFRYQHFGGDEAKTGEWDASPRIAERMAQLGRSPGTPVQAVFTEFLGRAAASHGRRLIGWDEIIEHDLPEKGTAVMYWRDSDKKDQALDLKALRGGYPLVLANWSRTYFDLYQKAGPGFDFEPLAICGHLPLEKVYEWRPLDRYPQELRHGVLGAQAQLWTEYIPGRSHLDYMAYPRACALSQVLWTGVGREPLGEFMVRLGDHRARLDRMGVAYRPF